MKVSEEGEAKVTSNEEGKPGVMLVRPDAFDTLDLENNGRVGNYKSHVINAVGGLGVSSGGGSGDGEMKPVAAWTTSPRKSKKGKRNRRTNGRDSSELGDGQSFVVASGGDVSFFVCTYIAAVKYADTMKRP